ncbi:hypothetical protein [Comamonas sediminis]|uniref:Uncharacterized protein n=1 Tax=Comamonas sediminis TaxID=1783360 RepID=A0ABV4B3G4_9BURK
MSINASDRTLGLISIWQVLRKLNWEIELIKAIPEKITVGATPASVLHCQDAHLYATINAASTSLAMVDWLYHTVSGSSVLTSNIQRVLQGVNLKNNKAFLLYLRNAFSVINACHQICNANKHFHLNTPDDQFKVMVGEIIFKNDDGTEDLTVITQIIQNRNDPDASTSVPEMLEKAAIWWEQLLTDVDLPGREDFFPASSKR